MSESPEREPNVTFRKGAVLSAILGMLAIFACAGRVEPSSGTTDCPAGQRFLNGTCATICAKHEECDAGETCLTVEKGGAACIPKDGSTHKDECTYLGSDTKCVGVGVYYTWSRGGGRVAVPYTSDPPGASASNTTSFEDPSFSTRNIAYYEPNSGCKGDATWQVTPSTTDPGCGQAHAVNRCRLVGSSSCVLVNGTTIDRPNL